MEEIEQRLADLSTTTVSKRFVDNIIRSLTDILTGFHTESGNMQAHTRFALN